MQTLLESVVRVFWSPFDMLVCIKCFKDLLHYFVMQIDRFLQFGYSLHKLDKEHLLSILLTIFGNEKWVTHCNSGLNILVVSLQA